MNLCIEYVGKARAQTTAVMLFGCRIHLNSCSFFFLSDFVFCTYIVLYILYMMTSVGSERTRGTRDKMQISATQPAQPQKQVVQVCAAV